MVSARRVVARFQYTSLADSAALTGDDRYGKGDVTIWYCKPSESILEFGNAYIRTNCPDRLPDPTKLYKTHIPVGRIQESNNSEVLRMMQSIMWSPRGEADRWVKNLGVDHVSMKAGDVIQRGRRVWMVDSAGWFEDLWLMSLNEAWGKGHRRLTKYSWEPYAHINLLEFDGTLAPFAHFHEYVQMVKGAEPEKVPIGHPYDFGYPIWRPWYPSEEIQKESPNIDWKKYRG